MGDVEEVQEQMKADMKAMEEQMATMMEVMMSMKNYKVEESTNRRSKLKSGGDSQH